MSITRERVLIVSDIPATARALRNSLAGAGFDAVVVPGFGEARAALVRSSFGLVVLDVEEPISAQFVTLLTSGHYGSRIATIVLSALEKLDARLEILSLGADFIMKPADPLFIANRARVLVGMAVHLAAERSRRVLLIDDSVTYGNAVAFELRKSGHDVVLATTAAEGIKYLSLQMPERVLVDVFLPDADGIDVARRIREMPDGRELPLLLLTGRESGTTRKRASQAGVTAFITKDSRLSVIAAWVWRPTQAGLDAASQSGTYGAVAISAPPSSQSSKHNDLFERVVAASGLSLVLGRSTLALALRRSGTRPDELTPGSLSLALEQIEKTLSTFLPPEAVGGRMSSIAELAQEGSDVVVAK
ncbi:MAG: response regulator [Myxococcota bacterium]